MGLWPEPWNGLENVLISEIIAPVATEINQPVDKGCNLLVQLVSLVLHRLPANYFCHPHAKLSNGSRENIVA